MKEPTYSIIVPTYNRPAQLKDCLSSLCQLDYPHNDYEIIVVDDGGEQDLSPIIMLFSEKVPITLTRQENQGPAQARNTGSHSAKGKYLAFIDDDCRADQDWLKKLDLTFKEEGEILIGGATINALRENSCSEASQALISYLYSYYNKDPENSRFFASNNMAISKSLFQAIGEFDVTTLKATAEDREICDRLIFYGYRLVFQKRAKVYHYHDLNLRTLFKQHFNYGKGAYYFRKVRSIRGQARIKVEPLSFYYHLVFFPFRHYDSKRIRISLLMILTQIANILGFFWESFFRMISREEIQAK